MPALYRLLRVGVVKTDTGQRIVPQSGDLWTTYRAWVKAGNVPDPYEEPPPPVPTLDQYKAARVQTIKQTGVGRLRTRFPTVADFDVVQLMREVVLCIAPAARAMTADFQWAADTYDAGKAAIVQVNAAPTKAAVDAVVVNWPAL